MKVLNGVSGGQNGSKDCKYKPGSPDAHIALGLSTKDALLLRSSFPKGTFGHPKVKRTGRSVDL